MRFLYILFCIILFLVLNCYSQPEPSSKKYLKQLIKEGKKDNFPGVYSIMACNEDSIFFKNDTVRFYDNPAYFSKIGICCEFMQWEFIDDLIIHQQEPQNCMDPSDLSVSSIHYLRYKIKKSRHNIFLYLFDVNKQTESFLLQNIEYIELPGEINCRGITLIRQPKNIQIEEPVTVKKIRL